MAWTLLRWQPLEGLTSHICLLSLPTSQSHYLRLILSEPHFRTSCLIVIGFYSQCPFIPAPSTLGSLVLPNLGTMPGVGHGC